MKLLLDSNALLWWTGLHHGRLTDAARKSIAEADQLFVSVATIWELEIKRGIGKLDFAGAGRGAGDVMAPDRTR
ncbi:hypothetical protein [Bosea sp. CS1GBMeth4]|uniref:type II toxin-antitoxin system VapC family toxin n=1 Tax=Bosea sp. CS1GBMeth4 TaxID=1892849 RepID=UPI001AEC8ABE|nr:hypothetical protein [Bosea sp. CS1GBMeth4]